jgi:hypothetical protein
MPHHADDQAIEDEAARAEADRLTGLALADIAVEITGALGLDRGHLPSSQGLTEQDVAGWLMRDYPTGAKFLPLLRSAVRRACTLLLQAGVAEFGETAFGVAADGEVTSVTGLLVPTRWGATLLADGRLGQYIRSCWARERATAPQLEPPPAGPKADWAQPAAGWLSPGTARTDWSEPEDDWLPPLDWPSDGTDWTAGNAASGHFAASPEWSGPEADRAPAATWPAGPPTDWAPPVLYGAPGTDWPTVAAWPATASWSSAPAGPVWSPPVPYVQRDTDRLIVEHILPGRASEESPGAQTG